MLIDVVDLFNSRSSGCPCPSVERRRCSWACSPLNRWMVACAPTESGEGRRCARTRGSDLRCVALAAGAASISAITTEASRRIAPRMRSRLRPARDDGSSRIVTYSLRRGCPGKGCTDTFSAGVEPPMPTRATPRWAYGRRSLSGFPRAPRECPVAGSLRCLPEPTEPPVRGIVEDRTITHAQACPTLRQPTLRGMFTARAQRGDRQEQIGMDEPEHRRRFGSSLRSRSRWSDGRARSSSLSSTSTWRTPLAPPTFAIGG